MEVYFIPLGYTIAVICIALILGVMWIWNVSTGNQDTIVAFANKHTDTVLLIFFIIAVVLGIIFTLMHFFSYAGGCDSKNSRFSMSRWHIGVLIPIKLIEYLLRFAGYTIPIFLSISLCYGIFIAWADSVIHWLSELVVVTIMVSPMLLLLLLGEILVSLIPLILILPSHLFCKLEDNIFVFFLSLLYTCGIGVGLTMGYHYFIVNHTVLLTYLH